MSNYVPSKEILRKYADVLVNFGLNQGKGVKPEEKVLIQIPECAKPMLIPIYESILEAKAYPLLQYLPEGISKTIYEKSNEKQLTFFPDKLLKGRVDEVDHFLSIISTVDPMELSTIDPKKILLRQKSFKPYVDWRNQKEVQGKLSWTLGLYGTSEMANKANLSLEEYWNEIIKACYLDEKDPVKKWQEIQKTQDEIIEKLNNLDIDKIHVEAKETDLWINLGKKRKWLGGRGNNIPSFEIFTSPDWRGTNGYITFTEPLFRYGNLIEDIYLEFKDGLVTKATAKKGEKLLKEMIATENANKIGEFSLTDSRLSKITKFMAETLFDENVGGKYGNTHIAVGMSYKDALNGDQSKLTKKEWDNLGFNDSVVHTDIVATSNRTVTAILKNKKEVVIYKDGMFQI